MVYSYRFLCSLSFALCKISKIDCFYRFSVKVVPNCSLFCLREKFLSQHSYRHMQSIFHSRKPSLLCRTRTAMQSFNFVCTQFLLPWAIHDRILLVNRLEIKYNSPLDESGSQKLEVAKIMWSLNTENDRKPNPQWLDCGITHSTKLTLSWNRTLIPTNDPLLSMLCLCYALRWVWLEDEDIWYSYPRTGWHFAAFHTKRETTWDLTEIELHGLIKVLAPLCFG